MKVLVTGGASGLGRAISERLAQDPANQVVVTFHRAEEAARSLMAKYSNLQAVRCDFSSEESLGELLAMVPSLNLDALVNNAVTGLTKERFHKIEAQQFLAGFQHNVMPVIQLVQAALPGFKAKRSGRILTVLTDALTGLPPVGFSEYAASKAYLASLSRSWTVEYARFGIVANCVSPAFMATDLNKDMDERLLEQLAQSNPTKQLLQAGEVAEMIACLLKASPQINGINLPINAGLAIQ